MPSIVSIAYTPAGVPRKPADKFARRPIQHAKLIADHGIDGDEKAQRGDRQLNIMWSEQVRELSNEGYKAGPGELGEQIVIDGLGESPPTPGTKLKLGESAVILVEIVREPCGRFEQIQGKAKELAENRIGVMASVLVGGEIAVGSAVNVINH